MRTKDFRPSSFARFCGLAVAAVSFILDTSASGSTPEHAATTDPSLHTWAKQVTPDFAFYAGKTVTFIVPAAIGGSFDDLHGWLCR